MPDLFEKKLESDLDALDAECDRVRAKKKQELQQQVRHRLNASCETEFVSCRSMNLPKIHYEVLRKSTCSTGTARLHPTTTLT